MLKRYSVILASLVIFFSLSSTTQAQQGADLAAAGLQSLVTELKLDESQKQEVDALIKSYTEKSTAIRTKVLELQTEMKSLELGNLTKKKIQRLSASTGKYSAQFTEQTLLLQTGFYAVLNSEQKAKFDELRGQIAERRSSMSAQ